MSGALIVMNIWSTIILQAMLFLGPWEGWEWSLRSSDPVCQAFLPTVPVLCQKPQQEYYYHGTKAYSDQILSGIALVGKT